MKIGAHIWIGKGLVKAVDDAISLGCDCFQIFLQNPRSWKRTKRSDDEVMNFISKVKENKLSPVVVHMPYILNLASPEKKIARMSQVLLEYELLESERLKADYYVIHPGSHKGAGVEAGIKNLTGNIKPFVHSSVKILVENTAGQGDMLGGRWEEFGYLFDSIGTAVGICFDTAHAFQAGYDIRDAQVISKILEEIKKYSASIMLVHANDSVSVLGSHLDRHQHIGRGYIGRKTFELLIKNKYFGALPFIIETPKVNIEADRRNLKILRVLGIKYGKV